MSHTFYLYARPSFLIGMASVIDIGGTLINYNISENPEEADTHALKSDWLSIGEDIVSALDNNGKSLKGSRNK